MKEGLFVSILIGLTGWGDHDSLYMEKGATRRKLEVYSSHFPVVEVDSAFYAIQTPSNYEKWVSQTPKDFSFVIKAHQSMTGHDRSTMTNQQAKELFKAYIDSIQPVIQAKKLNAILFQFPPWFDLNQKHIQKLRKIKSLMPDLPLALEFRNQSWFKDENRSATLQFMKEEGWIHSICDEPQAEEGSVPLVLESTSDLKTLVRFHGRNVHGWNRNGRDDWREVRFLYDYNETELKEWVSNIKQLQKDTKEITVLFNNNSGGHAAGNAKQLIELLNITYDNLNPKQMDIFHF
ncbi:DUF72 domain-containing protein [Aquibacillus koreensis]|uniref:DUF72 domain-containing protein n=1 Tax=Aquibacillus koreensis TaxID=279446 RepID=A0A9X3WKI2_9BACI|nr:DUF72 domain-containing protein [Aquibacillus koreensis]MCT2537325.1 DUF72 domain-containing protein [Aquibacillus koreensis]MDC3418771.1 DUF72 domain-containing protein [Aquibacillus koreensis]